eukprot:365715-Chlamydomonas_euryale.AAC.4
MAATHVAGARAAAGVGGVVIALTWLSASALLQHVRRQGRLVDEAVCMHAAAEAVLRFPSERVDFAKQTVWVGLFVRVAWPAE